VVNKQHGEVSLLLPNQLNLLLVLRLWDRPCPLSPYKPLYAPTSPQHHSP